MYTLIIYVVSLEKYFVKENEYYRLTHCIREGKKIVHKTKHIGKYLPSKQKLLILKEDFYYELLNEKYKFLDQKQIRSIEKKKKRYNLQNLEYGPKEKEDNLNEFIIRFTNDSSKLSGVDITLRQTFLILKKGVIPKDIKKIKTIAELNNHKKGIIAITKYNGVLNLKFINKLHKILMSGVWDEIAGITRNNLERNVKIAGTSYVPPTWNKIEKELNIFFKWYKSENRKLHPIELASLIHVKLISIQPFMDGNSRLSRLLMNWVLWKKDYPLIDIPVEDLEKYYTVLDKYQIEKKEKPFIDYIVKKYLEN